MITVQVKETSTPLSLGVDTKSKDKASFANLLDALKSSTKTADKTPLLLHLDEKKEIKTLKNTTKTLKNTPSSKDSAKKTDNSQLLSLLKGKESKATPPINPELLNALDVKTLKSVIKDAKNYLKEQIKSTDAFKKGEIKELPKTLQGLVEVAKKVGIDIGKITLETVQEKNTKTAKSSAPQNIATAIKKETHPEKNETPTTALTTALKEQKVAKTDTQTKQHLPMEQTLSAVNQSTKSENAKEQKVAKADTQTKQHLPIEQKLQTINEGTLIEETPFHVRASVAQDEQTQKQLPKQETSLTTISAQESTLSKLPLFATTQVLTAHSTAELINTKQTKGKEEHAPTKEPTLLSALLHGEKTPPITDTKITPSAEANIKTPSSVLSQLLHGENLQIINTPEQTALKTQTQELTQNSENSLHVESSSHTKELQNDLSVKINEAKQMTKYLAEDIKQAIEDYKAPFTRIKVKLNPEKLGEVDLTVVQRGKNIHVNISSNNGAIASLAQNVNELKTQLTQNGMNNATLNFSSATDAQTQQQQQQQNGQYRQGAKKAYEVFSKEDASSEEVLSSLEIVLPQYI